MFLALCACEWTSVCFKMADANEKLLAELLKKPGNNECADCGAKKNEIFDEQSLLCVVSEVWRGKEEGHYYTWDRVSLHVFSPLVVIKENELAKAVICDPEWASYNIGIFLCTRCAGVHRSMGAHISKVKHLKLDRWEDSQVTRVREVGNNTARLYYEERVPPCYRRPNQDAPQVLVEQWIRAKYEREEFCHPERQNQYVSGFYEGFLMKRGKEDARYHPRKFVLSEADDTLKYHVKENKDPKAVLRISELNVAFAPPKTGHPNSLQISFMKDGSTRHIYVYHEDPEVITNWYLAIRCAKLHRLQVAYPGASEHELLAQLTRDFPREGFLWKTGPRHSDAYKKRWFTLDGRKLMYHDDPMDAHPKGEIFIGHNSEGFALKTGVPPGAKDQGFSFTLETPDRSFLLSAQSEEDRTQWMYVIQKVIDKPLTPQDATVAARLVRKRTASGTMNIFSSTR